MDKLSTQRCAIWAVLVSLGWLSFLWINGVGGLFFFASYLVAMPREQLHRVVPRRELLGITCGLIAFVGLAIAAKFLTSPSADQAFERFFKNPAVVSAMWLLCLWLGFRGWRRKTHHLAP